MSKAPVRVLYLDHTPFLGGAQLVLVSHFKALDKTKFTPLVGVSATADSLGSPSLAARYRDAGAQVAILPFAKLKSFNPLVTFRLLHTTVLMIYIIRALKVDVVVTNTERAMYGGTLAGWLTGTPVVWWVRDFCYNRFLFKLLGRIPKRIIFVSKAVREFYALNFLRRSDLPGGQTSKGVVVYVGSDLGQKLSQVSDEEVQSLRREWGAHAQTVVVGFVGRLVGWKGGSLLLDAARIIKSQAPNSKKFKFVIVGEGAGQEGNIEPEMKQFIYARHLQDQVVMTGYREDIPVCLKVFDIFVHPVTEPEPFATTVVEAMLAGLPVIGVTIGGDPEIIEDGKTGMLIKPNNSEALAKALATLASDPELRRRWGEEGREYVMENNTEKVVTKQVEGVLSEVVNS